MQAREIQSHLESKGIPVDKAAPAASILARETRDTTRPSVHPVDYLLNNPPPTGLLAGLGLALILTTIYIKATAR
jgi:hypothetical protein